MKQQSSRKYARVEDVLAFLRRKIKKHAESKSLRLPTIAAMAAEADAALVTISKALRTLRSEGLITAAPRRGVEIVIRGVNSEFESGLYQPSVKSGRENATQILAGRIRTSLVDSTFGAGTVLPPSKILMKMFGTGRVALQKAMTLLETEGRVTKLSRGYRIEQSLPVQSHAKILVVVPEPLGPATSQFSRDAEFWRLLELECRRRRLQFEIVEYGGLARALAQERKSLLGYIVNARNASFDSLHNVVVSLESTMRPVAVYDETGKVTIPSTVSANPRMRLFYSSFSTQPGQMVGNYLLARGHRRVALFSALSNELWSSNRLRGVQNVFTNAGFGKGVTWYSGDGYDEWERVQKPRPDREPFRSVNPQLLAIQRVFNPRTITQPGTFYTNSQFFFWRLAIEAILTPLFEKALADKSITAWVCESDTAALCALDFLRHRKIKVPRVLSVVGFDASLEGLTQGLTSFDFNVPALVRALLDHVLMSSSSKASSNNGPLEIPGVIQERGSCGNARNARDHDV